MKIKDFIRLEKEDLIKYFDKDISIKFPKPNRKRKVIKKNELECKGLYSVRVEGGLMLFYSIDRLMGYLYRTNPTHETYEFSCPYTSITKSNNLNTVEELIEEYNESTRLH